MIGFDMTEHERGEHSGRQQVYNALLSHYIDAQDDRARASGGTLDTARDAGQSDALVWAAMVTWNLGEAAANERVDEDLEERWLTRIAD